MPRRATQRIGGIGSIAGTAVLTVVLLLLIPPHGILSDNEENYFVLAERFVDGSAWPRQTAVFDVSPHRTLSDATLGALIWAIGYTPAQVATRLLAVTAYALVLPPLFGAFGLAALDAAVVVMSMALIGQDIVGGEWLFSGYEAKVAAYILVLSALRIVLAGERLAAATLLFAVATYFHFLVGGFWFVAGMALRLVDKPRDLRRVATTVLFYVLLVMPLCGMIAWLRLADNSAALATDVPPPDVIYSIIREPHHQSPFISWSYFRDHWLLGYIMAAPMLLGCIWLARNGATRRFHVAGVWLAGLVTYLLLILGPKWLDRNSGALGKFYLFRPSSLIELLWLMLALAVTLEAAGRHRRLLRASIFATIGSVFLYVQGGRPMRDISAGDTLESQKALIVAAVTRLTTPGDIVLIDPELEMQWLDFERRTGRPSLVMWKFAPTDDADLITWYRRMERRKAVFDQGCDVDIGVARSTFLLTTLPTASRLSSGCGPEVFRVGRWVLLRKT